MSFRALVFAGTASLFVSSCTGGQTGDEGALTDQVEFSGLQCNKYDTGSVTEGLSIAALSSESGGLACLAWEREPGGSLQLELTHVQGPCLVEVDWQHRVTIQNGVLALVASGEPECRVAGCGSCLYSFRFAIPGQDAGAFAELSFALEICGELEEPWLSVTLPSSEDQGVLCKQLSADTLSWVHRSGGVHEPCGETGPDAGMGGSCETELTCQHQADAFGDLCLAPCESRTDCPLPVESCEEGFCRVPASF